MKTTFKASFKDFKINAKGEATVTLGIKGELTDAQILALHKLKATGSVIADIYDGQTDNSDFIHDNERSEEPHRGVSYTVNNGTVEKVDTYQIELDEAIADATQDDGVDGEVVVDEEEHNSHDFIIESGESLGTVVEDEEPSEEKKEIESMESEVSQEEREEEKPLDDDLPF